MYSHVQLNHHIPTDAQTREQKEEKNKQTNKKRSLIILEDTRVLDEPEVCLLCFRE